MFTKSQPPRIPLPKGWQGCVKSAAIYAFSLAHYCIVYARARGRKHLPVVALRRQGYGYPPLVSYATFVA